MTFIQWESFSFWHYKHLHSIEYKGTYEGVSLAKRNIMIPKGTGILEMMDETLRKVTTGDWIIIDDNNKFFQDLRYLPKV